MKASSDVSPASARARIATLRATQEWLVLERDDQIIGFAYGQPLKRLAAFQWGDRDRYVDIAHRQRRRRTRALRATAAPTHRAGLPARLRRHHPATAFIDPPGYAARDLLDTAARMDRLARPSPPPQVGYGPLKNRKDVRPAEQGRTKVALGRRCPVRTRFDRPENNLTPL
jgi:hypothetical protein